MARSVILGIASASIALALTAVAATPSSAMSFSDYDSNNPTALGNRASVETLFSGRLTSASRKATLEAEQLQEIRRNRGNGDGIRGLPARDDTRRPISLLLPFGSK